MSPAEILIGNLRDSANVFSSLAENPEFTSSFEKAASCLLDCYRGGGRLYIAGNGGSAADAQHLAAEFVSKLSRDRDPLPAEALTTDSSILTAIGNDYGYEHVFARQIQAKVTPRDVFMGITTSGRSANVLAAFRQCRQLGAKTIALTGKDGGEASALATCAVVVPALKTSTIQEAHIAIAHALCEYVENQIFFS
jgi:D-sedoheptulose 7-phosphate isomerase